MIRKRQTRAAKAPLHNALTRSEIHPDKCDDAGAVKFEVLKRALARINKNNSHIRDIKKASVNAGTFPLHQSKAESIASSYFIKEGENWLRSVAKLTGRTYADIRYHYRNQLPAQTEATEAAAQSIEGDRIDVDAILRQELGDDTDLSN